MDGHALFTPLPPSSFFLMDSHHPPSLGLLPDITEIPLRVPNEAEKENPSPPARRAPGPGLVLLEESLICGTSQRLVSRRNMVPML